MGMGHAANYADVVEESTVKQACPKAFNVLMVALEISTIFDGLDDLAQATKCDEQFEEKHLEDAFMKLRGEFEGRTGLPLDLSYHSSENEGGRYDDVDGHFWIVDNVYEMTKEAKKMEDKIERKFWCTFG